MIFISPCLISNWFDWKLIAFILQFWLGIFLKVLRHFKLKFDIKHLKKSILLFQIPKMTEFGFNKAKLRDGIRYKTCVFIFWKIEKRLALIT